MPGFGVIQKHSTVSGVILCSMSFLLLIFSIILFPYIFSCACNETVCGTSPARDDELVCDVS